MQEIDQKRIDTASIDIQKVMNETKKVIIGQDRLMRNLLIALLGKGHIILEGVPGLAKTLAIETLAKAVGLDFSRVQFTPDLLPSDLSGSQIWDPSKQQFTTHKWPIFAHLVLADEINRAPAKVQSALLEAMAERQITIGDTTYPLEEPFVVMATQNPVENDGTYDLPEAQLDRFLLKTTITYPTPEEEIQIMKRFSSGQGVENIDEVLSQKRIGELQTLIQEIHVSESMYEYVWGLVWTTRDVDHKMWKYIRYGASPRASLALITCAKVIALMHDRSFIIPEDIQEIAEDVLQHRIILSFEAMGDGVSVQEVIQEIVSSVKVV